MATHLFDITSTKDCSYCVKAKETLRRHNLRFRENLLDTNEKKKAFVNAGFKTVPQIYHNGTHIGGYDDLVRWLKENRIPDDNP